MRRCRRRQPPCTTTTPSVAGRWRPPSAQDPGIACSLPMKPENPSAQPTDAGHLRPPCRLSVIHHGWPRAVVAPPPDRRAGPYDGPSSTQARATRVGWLAPGHARLPARCESPQIAAIGSIASCVSLPPSGRREVSSTPSWTSLGRRQTMRLAALRPPAARGGISVEGAGEHQPGVAAAAANQTSIGKCNFDVSSLS